MLVEDEGRVRKKERSYSFDRVKLDERLIGLLEHLNARDRGDLLEHLLEETLLRSRWK